MSTLAETIERVKKLLALTTSSNAGEAANAAAAADKLIEKYRLSQYDLEDSPPPEEAIEQDEGYIYESGRVTIWRKKLIHTLTRHYGVAYWNHITLSPTGRQISRYRMVGRKSDMSIVSYMNAYLVLECERLSNLEAKGTGMGRVFVASYQEGFVDGVSAQLQVSRAEIKKEANSTAMVHIESRFAEAEAGMYNLVPNLKTSKSYSHRRHNGQAYGLGKQRGSSIHLGSAMAASSGTKLLSG
jgi:hypothetical protein